MTTMAAALAMTLLCALSVARAAVLPDCAAKLGVKSFNALQVLMVADPGGFSGSAEAKWFLANLQNSTIITGLAPSCAEVFTGMLLQQKVVVVTSGINSVNAALCTNELMVCNRYFESIIYSGTSGWSSAIGGILNTDDTNTCEAPNTQTEMNKITRVGDICVSPVSVNWNCRLASWSEQCNSFPNVCTMPSEDSGPTADYLYGNCVFDEVTDYNVALANELIAATKTSQFRTNQVPESAELQAYNKLYWSETGNGTGLSYYVAPTNAIPHAFEITECAEVDSQFFWSGVPWDMESRKFVAATITSSGLKNVTMKDVIAVSAMEAVGFMQVMNRVNKGTSFPDTVKYANVRTNSDWVHIPVLKLADGTWGYGSEFVPNFGLGYPYAIASFSNAILTTMQLRCLKLHPAAMCTFTIGPL